LQGLLELGQKVLEVGRGRGLEHARAIVDPEDQKAPETIEICVCGRNQK